MPGTCFQSGLNQHDAPLFVAETHRGISLFVLGSPQSVRLHLQFNPLKPRIYLLSLTGLSNSAPQPRTPENPLLTAKPRLGEDNIVQTHPCNPVPQSSPTTLAEVSSNLDYSETKEAECSRNWLTPNKRPSWTSLRGVREPIPSIDIKS